MKTLIIDGKLMKSKDSLYLHLKRVLALPNYFGNNLDALWDVLTEEDELTEIVFINTDQVKKHLGQYGVQLINLLEKLERQNKNYRVLFYS